jgi:phosphoenolpyruvate-protein kinase (PTS system EI component)
MVRRRAAAGRADASAADLDLAEERARLGRALAEAADEIAELERWATDHAPLDRATMLGLLSPSRFVLDDARLRGRMLRHVQAGSSAHDAVDRVMVEYARVLSAAGDPVLADRAFEVEALCTRVLERLAGPRRKMAPGTVLVASRLTVCDAIELSAGHGVAAILAQPAEASPGIGVAVALGLPVVAGVPELFRWVADGDRALVSGDSGAVTVNPSRVDVAAYRRR